MIQNNRFLSALHQQVCDATPIWIMRQAGRYLPEYRELRERAGSFMNLCKTPQYACEATMQPIHRFDLDAAILFSDILTIPDAFGLGLYFDLSEGPRFNKNINNSDDVNALPTFDIEKLTYVRDAIIAIKQELNNKIPLIGFSGSPFTLASYMVEGGSTKNFHKVKQFMYNDPVVFHKLLAILSEGISTYLIMQINAGVNVVQIFDSWGGVLTTDAFKVFSISYIKQIVKKVKDKHPDVPIITFTKGSGLWLQEIAYSGVDCIGVDWSCDLSYARSIVHNIALQGNLDPAILTADNYVIKQEIKKVLDSFGYGNGYIFNLGHGITQNIEPDKVKFVVDTVHEMTAR